jgi:hypothetical protein
MNGCCLLFFSALLSRLFFRLSAINCRERGEKTLVVKLKVVVGYKDKTWDEEPVELIRGKEETEQEISMRALAAVEERLRLRGQETIVAWLAADKRLGGKHGEEEKEEAEAKEGRSDPPIKGRGAHLGHEPG